MEYMDRMREWLKQLERKAEILPSAEAGADETVGSLPWLGKECRILHEELASEPADRIEDRFCQELSFGTAGLRGKLGAGTNRMNVLTVGRASQGIADYIRSHGQAYMDRGVIIIHDPRHYSRTFCELAAGIMAANGIRAYTFADMRPTPQLAFLIRRMGAAAGINITASHNPREYNGYKVYWEDGCQVSAETADGMSGCIARVDYWEGIRWGSYDKAMKEGTILPLGEAEDRAYLDRIEALAIHEGEELDLTIPLVYTPLNGCGAVPFARMLEERGFRCWTMVEEQREPDPDFATVGYPNPEDPAAFALSEDYGRRIGADLLLATDPDADRFAIEIRNSEGRYIPLNGNQTGYLLVQYILEGGRAAGTLPDKGAMVKSIVTSDLSAKIAADYGVEMFETLTGFKNICGRIPWLQEHGYTYLFGYEESIGYAACPDIRDKDGISAGMLVAEAAAYYRRQGRTLWDVLQEIYDRYGYAAEDEPNIVLEGLAGQRRIREMMEHFRTHLPEEVAGYQVVQAIDYREGYEDIPPQNALRIFLENGSWFALRPSGTEPKIKFYFYSREDSAGEASRVNGMIRDRVLALVQNTEGDRRQKGTE